jgi:hypothetical protein
LAAVSVVGVFSLGFPADFITQTRPWVLGTAAL